MIRAYHAIITAYGFWLPNDPRGSWSDWIRSFDLLRHGVATKVATHRSLAAAPHNRAARLAAKNSLSYPEVIFNGLQARAVGIGFQRAIEESGYVVYACSILPKHAHLVFARHAHRAEQIVGHLKGRATQQLLSESLHPLHEFRTSNGLPPSPWARKSWPVFLDSHDDIRRAIGYVEENPIKEGKPPQRWTFVVPFVPDV